MVKHPVLFETFARPEYARPVFESIKRAKPRKLYFYSNKARSDREDELKKNEEIRSWVYEIDWDCEVHTWFRDEYVDVYTSLMGSKRWLFSHEDTMITLEEDCLPSQAFFEYCDYFLDYYKDEKRIGFITGDNYTKGFNTKGGDHFITRSIHHFGWATWKDRWESYDFDLIPEDIIFNEYIEKYFSNDLVLRLYYKYLYIGLIPFINRTKCWDYMKVLNQFRDGSFAVSPIYNLVQNVGLNGMHTHNGKGPEFEFGNNDDKGNYPFTYEPIPVFPNEMYDYAESLSEGLRKKAPLVKKILRLEIKYRYPIIYNLLKKIRNFYR